MPLLNRRAFINMVAATAATSGSLSGVFARAAIAEDGWQASPDVIARYEKRTYKTIYREENVPAYSLPDALLMADGSKVTSAGDWTEKRRPEVLELFRKYVYGRAPIGRPDAMTFEIGAVNAQVLDGKATARDVVVNLTGKADGPRINMRVYTPNDVSKPVPCFLYLGRPLDGGHPLQSRWENTLPEIIARGYGLAVVERESIDPDRHDKFKNGVHGAFDPASGRTGDSWGTIAGWAWGLSRAMDYLETDKAIDAKRVAVMGVSRAGKTALWAGAEDERFAMTISICSGNTGAALSRRRFGEPVSRITDRFPHWFAGNYNAFNDKEETLPIDQHMLLSLMAPRLLYVMSADTDLWADPRGEFLASKNADTVYHLLDEKGLEADTMPSLENPVQSGRIGYHIRKGGHGLEHYDWLRFLDFADKNWK